MNTSSDNEAFGVMLQNAIGTNTLAENLYYIYLNVPIGCFFRYHPEGNSYTPLAEQKITLKIKTYAVVTLYSQVRGAIVLANEPGEAKRLIAQVYPDFPVVVMQHSTSRADALSALLEQVLYDPEQSERTEYYLFGIDQKELGSRLFGTEPERWCRNPQSVMEEKRLIASDGSITGYGQSKGLTRCLWLGGKGYLGFEATVRSCLPPEEVSSDTGLRVRLERLHSGSASSAAAEDAALKHLQDLLRLPLHALFRNTEMGRKLWEDGLQKMQGMGKKPETYQDALIWLGKHCTEDDLEDNEKRPLLEDMLDGLIFGLYTYEVSSRKAWQPRQSLRQRLEGQKLPALNLNIRCYYHTAARMTGTDYPLWLYETVILKALKEDHIDPNTATLGSLLSYAHNKFNQEKSTSVNFFRFAYTMLAASFDRAGMKPLQNLSVEMETE